MSNLIEFRGTEEELKPLNNLEKNLKKGKLILFENNYNTMLCEHLMIISYGGESIDKYPSNKMSILAEGSAFIRSPLTSKDYKNKIPIHLITKGNYNPIEELLRNQTNLKIKIIKEERFEGEGESKKHIIYYPNKISIGREQISKRLSEIFLHSF